MNHLFLSYPRLDNNTPVNAEGGGWVTAFCAELKRRHTAYSGRELKDTVSQTQFPDAIS